MSRSIGITIGSGNSPISGCSPQFRLLLSNNIDASCVVRDDNPKKIEKQTGNTLIEAFGRLNNAPQSNAPILI